MQNAPVSEAHGYALVTVSAALASSRCQVLGFFCSTTAAGTLELREEVSGAVIVPAFAPTAGQFHPLPFRTLKGLYVVVTGTLTGTMSFCAD